MQAYGLLKFAVARSNGSSFLLITQYEMPFINKSEATKMSKDRKINGKCTNATNRRSRAWLSILLNIIVAAQNAVEERTHVRSQRYVKSAITFCRAGRLP